jgi:hypothetical protein
VTWLPAWLVKAWRARFHRYEIDDPRPIAVGAPYTFHLPSENELLAIAPGDLVKITLRAVPASTEWENERLWAIVTGAQGEILEGALDNEPYDMPQIKLGDRVRFRRSDVVDIIWDEDRAVDPPSAPPRREYWARCLVDACVVEADVPVQYLYREEPEMEREGDAYPDSGWRIRGDYREVTDEELADRETQYIALGAVLNHDDSWVHLLDAPAGSAFIRNWQTGAFEPEGDDED